MTAPEVRVRFGVDGLPQVQRGLKVVQDQADPTARRWGLASRQIAGGLESVARQGKVTGEALKGIVAQGSDIAFSFGPTGAVVGALAITGAAIYEHIVGGMKAAQEEAKKTTDAINAMVDAGDKTGIYKKMSEAYRGTPSQNFADGVVGLTAERERIRRERDAWTPDKGLNTWRSLAAQLDAVNAKLAKQQQLFDQLRAAYNAPMPVAYTGQIAGMTTTESNDLATDRAGSVKIGKAPAIGRFPVGTLPRPQAITSAIGIGAQIPGMTDAERQMQSAAAQLGATFADTLADAIGEGVKTAFKNGLNIASIGKAIIASATAGLGNIAVAIGKKSLAVALAQSRVAQAIASWGPAGVAAAIALIAVGSAMKGAGDGYGGAGGGGGGGGYGSYSSSSGYGAAVIDRGIIDPTRQSATTSRSLVMQPIFFGHRDPVAQREFQEWAKAALARGAA